MLCCIVLYCTVLFCIILYCPIPYIALSHIILHCIISYCDVQCLLRYTLYYTVYFVLYALYFIPYYTILYYAIRYYTILHEAMLSHTAYSTEYLVIKRTYSVSFRYDTLHVCDHVIYIYINIYMHVSDIRFRHLHVCWRILWSDFLRTFVAELFLNVVKGTRPVASSRSRDS